MTFLLSYKKTTTEIQISAFCTTKIASGLKFFMNFTTNGHKMWYCVLKVMVNKKWLKSQTA